MLQAMKLFFLLIICTASLYAQPVETIYGTLEVNEPVLLELFASNGFCRLKEVHQYGITRYIHKTKHPYTRHTHSLGVFALLRMYGASLTEQIAGLLHDVSHTVFSHVGDHVLAQLNHTTMDQTKEAYQDNKHVWLLAQTDIPAILTNHGYTLTGIDHSNGSFSMLKRSFPDICADRLEYNLYGGYIEGWFSPEDIKQIITSLHYADGQWFFDNATQARRFAQVSIKLCEDIFAAPWNIGSYDWTATALLRAVQINLISMHDIHFGKDDETFALLQASSDTTICHALHMVLHAKELYKPSDETDYDLTYISKFRGIDPWVATSNGLQRLSALDKTFGKHYQQAKKRIATKRFFLEKKLH